VSYPGSPSVNGSPSTGKRPSTSDVQEALAMGRRFHGDNEEKAKAYAKTFLASKGFKV